MVYPNFLPQTSHWSTCKGILDVRTIIYIVIKIYPTLPFIVACVLWCCVFCVGLLEKECLRGENGDPNQLNTVDPQESLLNRNNAISY